MVALRWGLRYRHFTAHILSSTETPTLSAVPTSETSDDTGGGRRGLPEPSPLGTWVLIHASPTRLAPKATLRLWVRMQLTSL